MRTQLSDAPVTPLPHVESPRELLVRHARLAGRLISAVWALALGALLVSGAPAPAGDLVLVVTGLGLAAGAVVAMSAARRHGRLAPHVLAGTLTLHATAVALALDATGSIGAAATIVAAAFAGVVMTTRAAAAAHVGVAALAPVLVAAVAGARSPEALAVAMGIAPAALLIGAVAAGMREVVCDREAAFRALARRDPLTGVGNYRRLHERLAETVARDPQRFALLTMDVDSFKAINDQLGHLEGDRLLREVGRALVDNVRGKDIVARQGGDEFAVLAPETDGQGAQLLAHRIERALEQIKALQDTPVSASIGIAVYPDDGRTPEELLARSDDALRREKTTRKVPARA